MGFPMDWTKGRVGRIKGLGNAIVPQIAWFIGNANCISSERSRRWWRVDYQGFDR